jgi:hypothetical protein
LRNHALLEAIMDLRFLSRNAETAERSRNLVRQRGYVFGNKIWDEKELQIIRATAHLTIPQVQKRLAHRTAPAIEAAREKHGVSRRKLKPWTTHEDRILKANIDRLGYPAIAKLLPGRNEHAVQGRAWYLGVRKGCARAPKAKGLPVYDEIRNRAYEDGLSLYALDRELGTGKYFQDSYKKTLNWEKLARAVAFFGGQMTIDWSDV